MQISGVKFNLRKRAWACVFFFNILNIWSIFGYFTICIQDPTQNRKHNKECMSTNHEKPPATATFLHSCDAQHKHQTMAHSTDVPERGSMINDVPHVTWVMKKVRKLCRSPAITSTHTYKIKIQPFHDRSFCIERRATTLIHKADALYQ